LQEEKKFKLDSHTCFDKEGKNIYIEREEKEPKQTNPFFLAFFGVNIKVMLSNEERPFFSSSLFLLILI